jgi:hypothetical protein
MNPFNLFQELKAVFRWGFLFFSLGVAAQVSPSVHFQIGSTIKSAKNTPVPVFCADSTVFVTYKTRFKRASKSEIGYAKFELPSLAISQENLVIPKSSEGESAIKISPFKKFYTQDGIIEIGGAYDSRKIEKSFYWRKISWLDFKSTEWSPFWSIKDKLYKNYVPNFRFSQDSTALLGIFEMETTKDSYRLEILRIDLKTSEIFSKTIPALYSSKEFTFEGFVDFPNGKIGILGVRKISWEQSQKELWLYDPISSSFNTYLIPFLLQNSEMKIIKQGHKLLFHVLVYNQNSSIFHQIQRWEFNSNTESIIESRSIPLTEPQLKMVNQSFHRLSGHWLGIRRNEQRNFKIFNYLATEKEEWLVVQAIDQVERCSQATRGIPQCNWVYSYGDVLLFQISKDSSQCQIHALPRYREYDVQLLQGDAGFPFLLNGEIRLLYGDEYPTKAKRRQNAQSTVIFTPISQEPMKRQLIFVNKKEKLFLDETTGVHAGENQLIFGGLKNKKSTIIKINLQ